MTLAPPAALPDALAPLRLLDDLRLLAWAGSVGGWQVLDNSTGFLLPDG